MKEHRVYGGPGCGKTTYLSKQIAHAVRTMGPNVLVCSFSNAAANELITRDLPIPRERVGTLHSFCRRALGDRREIAETVDLLEEWNGAHPSWLVPHAHTGHGDSPVSGQSRSAYARMGALRNRMVPVDRWPGSLQKFWSAWSAWKAEHDLYDFTDLIEICNAEEVPAPFEVNVLFADEAQDYSALEISVIRRWGEAARYFILAGDDQQALYDFRGASAEVMLTPELPAEQITILDKSWRLPSEILSFASNYGAKMTRRQPKDIRPVSEGGEVGAMPTGLKLSSKNLASWVARQSEHGTVMVLAAADFMLTPVMKGLRDLRVPFGNPYRPTSARWNPLRRASQLTDLFTTRPQTWSEMWKWAEEVNWQKAGAPRGAKKKIKEWSKEGGDVQVTPAEFEELIGCPLPDPDPDWLFDHITGKRAEQFGFARAALKRYGAEVVANPRVIVGTYHSVKGGEADTVVMSFSLTGQHYRTLTEMELASPGTGYDALRRMFYVGMTRAKKRLVLVGRCEKHAARITERAPIKWQAELRELELQNSG